MNKKTLSLLAAASIALFSACSNTVESTDSQATLNVLVRNSITGSAVPGATVKLLTGGESKVTDASGIARFDKIPAGVAGVRVDASGYVSAIDGSRIDDASPSIATEHAIMIAIAPALALIGSAYYEEEITHNLKAAEGATIRITLRKSAGSADINLVKEVLETTVSADGKYTFDTLPAGFEGTISGLENKFGDIVYEIPIASTTTLTFGATPTVNADLIYKPRGPVNSFQLLGDREIRYTNPTPADSLKEIVLNFTDSIDITRNGSITISNGSPVDIVYSDDHKTVTVRPFGKWKGDFTITVSGFYSGEGQALASTNNVISVFFSKKPGLVTDAVTNVAFTGSDIPNSKIFIVWEATENATDYRILAIAEKGYGYYTQVGTLASSGCSKATPSATKETCTSGNLYSAINSNLGVLDVSGNPVASLTGGGKIKVIVQAYTTNNQSQSKSAEVALN